MRCGWFTPRSFDLAGNYCGAAVIAPASLFTPNAQVPAHFFHSNRPLTQPEHYMVEYRSSLTRFDSSVASAATGSVQGAVFRALQTVGATGQTAYEQVLAPGPDDIRGGLNRVVDTPFIAPPAAGSGNLFHIPCVFPTNNPSQ